MNSDWNWHLNNQGTIEIYYKNCLCWELDGYAHCEPAEQRKIIYEFILQNQYILRDID